MRKLALLLLVTASVIAPAQIWEKTLAPGLTYRMELDTSIPRVIHVLRFSPKSGVVQAQPELSDHVVYTDNDSKGRQTISALVAQNGAIAGINGDFFPYTGDPLGLMVRDGELISVPAAKRASFGWGSIHAGASLVKFSLVMQCGAQNVVIDGLNEECGLNRITLDTPTAGLALAKAPNLVVAVKVGDAKWTPTSTVEGVVESLSSDQLSSTAQPGYAYVIANGTKIAQIQRLKVGDKVRFKLRTEGFDWKSIPNVIGGGPLLVQENQVDVDWKDEGFKPEFAEKRHPRSAVGRTVDGDLIFVCVDGRQTISAGVTLEELGAIMKRLGCIEAMNLDGGGSTTMNISGLLINRPNEDNRVGERKVANGVLFFASQADPPAGELTVHFPDKVIADTWVPLEITDAKGNVIPNSEIVWSATGSGFIDQGGVLRYLKPGTVNVAASVRGQLVGTSITVLPKAGKS